MKNINIIFFGCVLTLFLINYMIYYSSEYKLHNIDNNSTNSHILISIDRINTFDKLLKYIEVCVLKYLTIFQDCFNRAFGGVLYIILKLVSLYFYTFQFCFSYILNIFKILILNYYDLMEFMIYRLTTIPNNLLIVIIFIVLYAN